ncbi:MAG: DUF4410 domain-containing protein [Planctomycetes bacterium]|nr:DUF4410 domain-containing protein [Planctomycetota bacterium]
MLRRSLVACVLFAGCAVRTPVPQVDVNALRGNLAFEEVWFRDFTSAPDIPNATSALGLCEGSCRAHLASQGLFRQVARHPGSSSAGGAVVDVHLQALRIVGGAARFWGGALAGRSHMKVHAKLTDSATGGVIAEEDLMGAPNVYGSAYSGGAADRALPEAMGRLLGDWILSHAGRR